jgi:hypothetical protein
MGCRLVDNPGWNTVRICHASTYGVFPSKDSLSASAQQRSAGALRLAGGASRGDGASGASQRRRR